MRTVAYVDGYNLYYGRLRGTPYKWLNLRQLLAGILHIQNPDTDLRRVAFCSAGILARFASKGQASVEAQTVYHEALRATGVEIVLGRHEPCRENLPSAEDGKPNRSSVRKKVWRMEEKETDVRLALGLYRDAMSGEFDQAVLVTSDTDLVPALEAIRQDAPGLTLGLILPRWPNTKRPESRSLSELCSWTRSIINDDELESAQFPVNVHRDGKKHLPKPQHWYAET